MPPNSKNLFSELPTAVSIALTVSRRKSKDSFPVSTESLVPATEPLVPCLPAVPPALLPAAPAARAPDDPNAFTGVQSRIDARNLAEADLRDRDKT